MITETDFAQLQQVLIQLIDHDAKLAQHDLDCCQCDAALQHLPPMFSEEVHSHLTKPDSEVPLDLYMQVVQCRHHLEMTKKKMELDVSKKNIIAMKAALKNLIDPNIDIEAHLKNETLRLNAFHRTTI